MGFRINTNVASLNAQTSTSKVNRALDSSLEKLSSGLRINKAADDASGMVIADSLRAQADGLGQAISNANDGINIIQIADKAMDEQVNIINTIKTKSIQAAQDGQTSDSRNAIQNDISKLLNQVDNIAAQTSYNGQNLLDGSFSGKDFQVGAYQGQTVGINIGDTTTKANGTVSFRTLQFTESGSNEVITLSGEISDFVTAEFATTWSTGDGAGTMAKEINKTTAIHGIQASYKTEIVISGMAAAPTADIDGFVINGVQFGEISQDAILAGDSNGTVRNLINSKSSQTGVEASVDQNGFLVLSTADGRGIAMTSNNAEYQRETIGTVTLSRMDGKAISFTAAVAEGSQDEAAVVNFSTFNSGTIASSEAAALGAVGDLDSRGAQDKAFSNGMNGGVTTMAGAQAMVRVSDSAIKSLDSTRAALGSTQNQLVATVNNISVTQVNVEAAQSSIRDVDFAAESANFAKQQILAQSGTYAMSQANSVQQNVLTLLR